MDLAGFLAICIGLFQIQRLPWKRDTHSHTLDTSLLRFGLFFNFVFAAFSGALSIFPDPQWQNFSSVHLVAALASILYCTFNVLFIELLLHKTVDQERVQHMHGRQVKESQNYFFSTTSKDVFWQNM